MKTKLALSRRRLSPGRRGSLPVFLLGLCLCLAFLFPRPGMAAGTDADASPPAGPGVVAPAAAGKDGGLKLDGEYLRGYLYDTGKILGSPLRWEGRDWLTASFVVAASVGLYAYDQDIKDWFQDKRNSTTNDLAKVFTPIGNPLLAVPAMGLVYLYGEHRQSEKAKRIGLLGVESIVLSGAFTGALKFATHRPRPDTGERYNKWEASRFFSTDNISFPSLHTSTAFSMAKVLAAEADNPYVTPVVYALASLVGLARLNDNDHWASDAFVGAAIGYFTAAAVLRYHQRQLPVAILPSVSRDGGGVMLAYRY